MSFALEAIAKRGRDNAAHLSRGAARIYFIKFLTRAASHVQIFAGLLYPPGEAEAAKTRAAFSAFLARDAATAYTAVHSRPDRVKKRRYRRGGTRLGCEVFEVLSWVC